MIENQPQTKISIYIYIYDNGTEYVNTVLNDFIQEKGIIPQSTCCDTFKQNGIAERKNKQILEITQYKML